MIFVNIPQINVEQLNPPRVNVEQLNPPRVNVEQLNPPKSTSSKSTCAGQRRASQHAQVNVEPGRRRASQPAQVNVEPGQRRVSESTRASRRGAGSTSSERVNPRKSTWSQVDVEQVNMRKSTLGGVRALILRRRRERRLAREVWALSARTWSGRVLGGPPARLGDRLQHGQQPRPRPVALPPPEQRELRGADHGHPPAVGLSGGHRNDVIRLLREAFMSLGCAIGCCRRRTA
ncbi:hypothetical protein [Dactylosporangium sp. NPDC051541]|uniref:hypothetical protein n=1 Tax=Dactylosporangium sp. NPDC051541 TaxID=3363977 RepID=UPI0037AE0BF5